MSQNTTAPHPPIAPTPQPDAPSRYSSRRTIPTIPWPILALALLLLFNAIFTRGFFHFEIAQGQIYGTLIDILKQATPVMIVAAGMTLVIATGGVDLSVGAVAAIAGSLVAWFLIEQGFGPSLAITLTLLVCLALGLWHGILVAVARIQPIVATLILMVAGRGIAQMTFEGQNPSDKEHPAITHIAHGFFLALPFSLTLVALTTLLVGLLARRTAAGLFIESTGSNLSASHYAGVNTRLVQLLAYAVTGLLSGVAGLWYVSNIVHADANNAGLYLELDAILAVVIGGTALTGGRFYLIGSLIGAIVIQTLTTTILMVGIPPEYNLVIKALVVLAVCLLQSDQFREAILPRNRKSTIANRK